MAFIICEVGHHFWRQGTGKPGYPQRKREDKGHQPLKDCSNVQGQEQERKSGSTKSIIKFKEMKFLRPRSYSLTAAGLLVLGR